MSGTRCAGDRRPPAARRTAAASREYRDQHRHRRCADVCQSRSVSVVRSLDARRDAAGLRLLIRRTAAPGAAGDAAANGLRRGRVRALTVGVVGTLDSNLDAFVGVDYRW